MALKNKTKYQSGFSVIEVFIALFIIGVSLIVFQSTANSVILNKYGRYREVALRIADKKIQTLRTTAFASIPPTGSFTDTNLSTLPNGQANLTTTNLTDTVKEVTVTITWTRPDNSSTQQIELQTYIYQGGLGQ